MRVQSPQNCCQKIAMDHPKILKGIEAVAMAAIVVLSVLAITGHVSTQAFAIGCLASGGVLFTSAAIQVIGKKLCTQNLYLYGTLAITALALAILPVLTLTRQMAPVTLAAANLTVFSLVLGSYCIIKGFISRR
jgi:hypothetical protein